ncbi:MAG TPA: hypothetical protein VIM08_00565 [Arthrobacter sp.]
MDRNIERMCRAVPAPAVDVTHLHDHPAMVTTTTSRISSGG